MRQGNLQVALFLFAVGIAVSAKKSGGKSDGGKNAISCPEELKPLGKFCTDLVGGKLINSNSTYDDIITDMTSSCDQVLTLIEDLNAESTTGPSTDKKRKKRAAGKGGKKGGGKKGGGKKSGGKKGGGKKGGGKKGGGKKGGGKKGGGKKGGGKKRKKDVLKPLLKTCNWIQDLDVDAIPWEVLSYHPRHDLKDIFETMYDVCDTAEHLAGVDITEAREALGRLSGFCQSVVDGEMINTDSTYDDAFVDVMAACNDFSSFVDEKLSTRERKRRQVSGKTKKGKKGGKKGGGKKKKNKDVAAEELLIETCDFIEDFVVGEIPDAVFDAKERASLQIIMDAMNGACVVAQAVEAETKMDIWMGFCDRLVDGEVEYNDVRFEAIFSNLDWICEDLVEIFEEWIYGNLSQPTTTPASISRKRRQVGTIDNEENGGRRKGGGKKGNGKKRDGEEVFLRTCDQIDGLDVWALPEDPYDDSLKGGLACYMPLVEWDCEDAREIEAIVDNEAAQLPVEILDIAHFCNGLVNGDVSNDNSDYDVVFSEMADTCDGFLTFMEETLPDGVKSRRRRSVGKNGKGRRKNKGGGNKRGSALLGSTCKVLDKVNVDDISEIIFDSAAKTELQTIIDEFNATCDVFDNLKP